MRLPTRAEIGSVRIRRGPRLRLLADENVPAPVVAELRARQHDVAWISEDAPGLCDEDVLSCASAQDRLLATLDRDFGELVFRRRLPCRSGVVFLRLRTRSPRTLAASTAAALESRDDWRGHFAVVRAGRIRLIALPSG
ncbi:MAG: hypothetical protein FJX75_23370 [Armatimonadetes bacterium]|nr:hypothetical protein [Armatimonadota bacterium]